jgi:hypothetical protein
MFVVSPEETRKEERCKWPKKSALIALYEDLGVVMAPVTNPAAHSVNLVNPVWLIWVFSTYGFSTSASTISYKNKVRFR